jgi:hypothetical protein
MRENYLDLKTLIEEKYPYVVLRPPKVPFFELTITSIKWKNEISDWKSDFQ